MHTLFSSPFRTFFLLANAYAVVAIGLWAFTMSGLISLSNLSLQWHIREMLLGFVGMVMLGFLLTASANWTGQPALKGKPLMLLALLWLCGRLAWLFEDLQFVGALLDATVYLGGTLKLGAMVFATKNQRNYPFVLVLALFSAFCLYEALITMQGGVVAIKTYMLVFFLMVHVVLVMGGRVIPFFTDRGLQRTATIRYPWLERASLLASVLFIVGLFAQAYWVHLAPDSSNSLSVLSALAGVVALVNLVRLISWKPWQTLGNAMLWPLHLSYGLMCLGFALFSVGVERAIVMHIFAIGGFGLIILSMSSRVSLGHTGRALKLPPLAVYGFALLLGSMVFRVIAVYFPHLYSTMLMLSGMAWVLAYGGFVLFLAPILMSPRVDGR